VSILHFDIWGYICADNFDDADATVICRELGFHGGFAYFQVRYNNPKSIGEFFILCFTCHYPPVNKVVD